MIVKMVKYFFVLLVSFCFIDVVNADVCDSNQITNLKKQAEAIEISYEYFDEKVVDGNYLSSYYDVYLSNINEDFSLKIDNVYHSPINGEFKFVYDFDAVNVGIYSSTCEVLLRTIKVELPWKNPYYDSDICYELKDKDLYVCEEWPDNPITEEEFNEVVGDYITEISADDGEKNSFLNYIFNNPLKIGGGLAFILIIFVFFIIRYRKRSVL